MNDLNRGETMFHGNELDLRDARACFCVMARRPGAGMAKTRLASCLDETQRASLYEAFLRDKLAQVARIRDTRAIVAVAPPDTPASIAPWLSSAVGAIAQRGADLGARLEGAMDDLFAAGASAVVMLDSDTPTLPDACLEDAARALASGEMDLVLGPAWDGGYYAIGLRSPVAALFRGIHWSTPAVLRETLAAADAAHLRVHLLQSWFDVDEPADLELLCEQLASMSRRSPSYPAATAKALGTHLRKSHMPTSAAGANRPPDPPTTPSLVIGERPVVPYNRDD
jgi:rSAM/selenodomain-associated transferase 1